MLYNISACMQELPIKSVCEECLTAVRLCLAIVRHLIHFYINGLVQERCRSIANALELHLSCTNPSIWIWNILSDKSDFCQVPYTKCKHCKHLPQPSHSWHAPVWCVPPGHRVKCHTHINGLVQERRNSSAIAMEVRLSCGNPSILLDHTRAPCR